MTITVQLPRQVAGRCLHGLRQQLFDGLRRGEQVVLDCSRVEELSVAGQALLVAARRAARSGGGHFYLHQPTTAMISTLRGTGLTHLLTPPAPATPAPQRQASR